MTNTSLEELNEAYKALLSMLQKCEKIDMTKLGQSQETLLKRRMAALETALKLIKRELNENYPTEL